ncbi:MAG: hypothetical protein NTX33_17470 [Propionibacteriales bacterium]|nr:hypothetical protein [Propionibacteriales bacterium]
MKQEPSVVDALALAVLTVDDLLVATARDTHTAIARRAHGLVRVGVGSAATPVETLHTGVAALVYGSLGITLKGAAKGLGKLGEAGVGPALDATPRGRFVRAAVNGLIGEELTRDHPQLAIEMGVRHEGRDVVLTPDGVAGAFPDATGQLVVFLHGLCENEAYWNYHRDRTGTTYGERVAENGWTPVYLRANTGLPLRENGVALAAVIQRLVDAWPTEVTRIALVGHSLGGLIMRASSAVVADGDAPAAWTDLVSDVITLGTPHLGSWFAVSADRASRTLARAPEVAAFGRIIDRQAPGIRDLIEGLAEDVPPLPHARYRLVSATLARTPQHPLSRAIGDLLVTPQSATGRDKRKGTNLFPGAEVLRLPNTDHFSLLNHPDLYPALDRWLCTPSIG